ncbi:MAG: outer membrane protein assembly factor BamE [Pseudomonadota bacterium]|jgi:outer membrane protein assembly factor BamE (lipoprotein component of BamABCDE complex)|nr:outer membrane protein assembly factor BamE [Alphaproteobacteria bacterium]
MRSYFWLGMLILILAGCYPTIDHRGFNPEEIQVDKIKVDVSTQETVQDVLGSPSTTSLFPVEGKKWSNWYYIYRKTETTSFFMPKVVDQLIIKVVLDEKGIVRELEQQKGVQGEEVKVSKERTPTTGYESSVMRDVFGGFGKSLEPNKK